jgi:hypothetical protein
MTEWMLALTNVRFANRPFDAAGSVASNKYFHGDCQPSSAAIRTT